MTPASSALPLLDVMAWDGQRPSHAITSSHGSSLIFLRARKAVFFVHVAALLARAVVGALPTSWEGADHGAGKQRRYIHEKKQPFSLAETSGMTHGVSTRSERRTILQKP